MASFAKQLLVLAVLGGAGYFGWQHFATQPAPEAAVGGRSAPGVIVAEARAGQVERVISSVGSGRALRSVELRFSVAGRVSSIEFHDGDAVERGAVLARLDDAAERAALAEAQADLQEARSVHERSATLLDQKRLTASAFDTAKSALLRAEARLDSARTDLDHMILRAPFPGTVGFSQVDEGAVVATTTPIGTLDDISELDVEFPIPERFFGEVAVGAAVRARTRIFPDEIVDGQVAAIDRRVDEVSRAFLVRARFANPDLRLPAGVFMQVDLVLDSRPGVLAPEEALVTEAGEVFLFVIGPDSKAQKRSVTLGGRRAGEAEVIDGLAPGEKVVVRGVQKVRDGAPVRVLGEEPRAGGEAAAGAQAPAQAPASAG